MNKAEKFYYGREMIINAFKNKIFAFYHGESRFEDEDEDDIKEENGFIDYESLNRVIFLKEWDTNNELVRKIFIAQDLRALLEKLKKSKNAEKNKIQVSLVRSGLRDLTGEIEKRWKKNKNWCVKMKKTWKSEWNSGYCSGYCNVILEYNEQNQEGQGLKILTISRNES